MYYFCKKYCLFAFQLIYIEIYKYTKSKRKITRGVPWVILYFWPPAPSHVADHCRGGA